MRIWDTKGDCSTSRGRRFSYSSEPLSSFSSVSTITPGCLRQAVAIITLSHPSSV